ncbi:MAG: hypothetical protein IPQ07_42205 [Myxococcales bacterium]|nr:hypothetical protein [Myxococcales bacterium]
MSRRLAMAGAALVSLVFAGCGTDDVDLTGAYEITSNVASSPCGADQPVANGPAFLVFRKEKFLSAEYFVFDRCADAAGTDCSNTGSLFSGLFEPIDGGWQGVATSSSHSGTRCLLGYSDETAKLAGSALVVEHSEYVFDGDLAEAECTTDEADRRGTTMDCDEHERIEATRR